MSWPSSPHFYLSDRPVFIPISGYNKNWGHYHPMTAMSPGINTESYPLVEMVDQAEGIATPLATVPDMRLIKRVKEQVRIS